VLFCSGTTLLSAAAPIVVRSQSGQFVVRGAPLGQSLAVLSAPDDVAYVRLDPTLLTVTLERVKQAILTRLALPDQWRGPVYVNLKPSPRYNAPIVVTRLRHPDNWSYRVTLPEQVDKNRFLKAAVEIVLMEIANRHATHRSSELPPWLAAGLAAELNATLLAPLTLQPKTITTRDGRQIRPLQRVREVLREKTPLRLDDLNFPPPQEEMTEEQAQLFDNCAHLFVHELLGLRRGSECLREMLRILPDYLNWQTAFLRAFRVHFPRLVDVDKWWALNIVLVSGREMFSLWPEDESLRRLAETLNTSVQVRTRPNELPLTTQVSLQRIIREWEPRRQAPLLRQKLRLLDSIRPRMAKRAVQLADHYREVIADYSDKRNRWKQWSGAARPSLGSKSSALETINLLNELDAQRNSLLDRVAAATQMEAGNVDALED
jgi:hypothetical protein